MVYYGNDLSVQGLEALWVETHYKNQTILIAGFYRPPNSNNNYWTLLEESFDRGYNTSVNNIIITGDFNINTLTQPNSKIDNLIASYNFTQLISEPTNFTEHSQSLLDLIIVKNIHTVLTSFVADPFIPDLTRYHSPIVIVLTFPKPEHTSFKRHIWKYDEGDFDKYRQDLNNTNWETLILANDLETSANNISTTIINSAKQSIPNKIVTIRPNDIPWMKSNVRQLIRQRRRLHKKAKNSNTEQAWTNFRTKEK